MNARSLIKLMPAITAFSLALSSANAAYGPQQRPLYNQPPQQQQQYGQQPQQYPAAGPQYTQQPQQYPAAGPQYGQQPQQYPAAGPQYTQQYAPYGVAAQKPKNPRMEALKMTGLATLMTSLPGLLTAGVSAATGDTEAAKKALVQTGVQAATTAVSVGTQEMIAAEDQMDQFRQEEAGWQAQQAWQAEQDAAAAGAAPDQPQPDQGAAGTPSKVPPSATSQVAPQPTQAPAQR